MLGTYNLSISFNLLFVAILPITFNTLLLIYFQTRLSSVINNSGSITTENEAILLL